MMRKFPIGAEVQNEGVHFRVWAPQSSSLELILKAKEKELPETYSMKSEENGYHSLHLKQARAGMQYAFRMTGSDFPLPDPASRYQPHGPFGFSEIVNPQFDWTDNDWPGCTLRGQVVYEMHVGTFTEAGTWNAALSYLPELKSLGITLIEMMPIAEFPGKFGWGYDGVDLFAPYHEYGTPDNLKRFVNEAHKLGIGVILDVVYNHLGPSGNFLKYFSKNYFTDRYQNDWGDAVNLDGPQSKPVREFFIANGCYWIDEFHFDGLRVDATQSIFDQSSRHFLAEFSQACRHSRKAPILLIAENEPQEIRVITPLQAGGYGFDMIWNDDFHHSWIVALTGKREGYYFDYKGTVEELALTAKWGFLYQGQYNRRQKKTRGSPSLTIDSKHFVCFLQNHDQVANSIRGERLDRLTSPGLLRASTMALLLLPSTPHLFQGQEFASTHPFCYFADHEEELAQVVAKGRRDFLSQFESMIHEPLSLPHSPKTFRSSKLDHKERETHPGIYRLHKDLLSLRRHDAVLSQQNAANLYVCTVGTRALMFRFFDKHFGHRLMVINLGFDLSPVESQPNPLLTPPAGSKWELVMTTEDVCYGGNGIAPSNEHDEWTYLAQCGYFFREKSA